MKCKPLRVRNLVDNGTSTSERSDSVATLLLTASKADFESARQYNFILICCGLGDG